jgi:polysaccharide chain length determinant protein (PEP-CTERM system associated)
MQPMQPVIDASYTSVRRRTLDVEDYIDILRRHKAWILGPAFGALVLAVVIAFLWPDTYVSSAIIRVVPPQVPESYVPTNVNVEMSQRINSMAQTILSRGNLTNIINTFNLYRRERQRKPMEDVVEQMRHDIRIGNVVPLTQNERGVSAFRIEFAYQNRIEAQRVCSDLVSRFISEQTRDRTQQSVLTTQFMKDQWDQARKELEEIDNKLMKFRTQNAGRLPDQMQTNWTQLSALENRVANLNGMISRTNQEKLLLETELRTSKQQLAALTPPPDAAVSQAKNDALVAADRDISNLETQLAALREHYKDNYPDVQRVRELLNVRKRERDQLQKDEAAKKDEPPPAVNKRQEYVFSREQQNIQQNIERIEAAIKTRDMQVADFQRDLTQTDRQIKDLQARLAQLPVGEKEYAEIVRDRELARQKYDDLNRKRSQSEISSELEKRQQGETLEILDSASLPPSPTEPKRPMLIAMGSALGIVFGVFLAGAREAKDTSLKNLKDVRAYTQLTILGSVPLLENDLVVRRRKRLAWLAWSTACLLGIIIMTGAVVYYELNKV